MARLSWSPPPLRYKCEGVRLDYTRVAEDMATLTIHGPEFGELRVTVAGENMAQFERQIADPNYRPAPDRLGHLAHHYREPATGRRAG